MKHVLTHIPSNHSAHHASKAKHKQNHTNESSASSETANFLLIQRDYLVLKDAAASDGLKVLGMSVKSFGYGTSTVVETRGATDTFAVRWGVKMLKCLGHPDIILQCDPEPPLTQWAESANEIQTPRANNHPKFSQTITSEQRSSGKLSKTVAGTNAHNVGSTSRPHAIQTDH